MKKLSSVDNELFFGNCALVAYKNNELDSLNKEQWNKIYEHLFGGFEDLSITAQDDFYEEDELDDIDPALKTKAGYLKDGFIVDTNSEDEDKEDKEESEEEDDEEESEEEMSNSETSDYTEEESEEEEMNSELSKEDYSYSDED